MKIKKTLATLLTAGAMSLGIGKVNASDIAYVVEDNTFGNAKHQVLYNIFNEFNLQRETIKDSQVPTTDFSQYSMVILADNIDNESFIPYNDKNTIFFDTDSAVRAWEISGNRAGTTQSRNIRSTSNSNLFFGGVAILSNNDIQVYNTFTQPITINYLISPLPSEVTRVATTGSTSQSTLVYSQDTINDRLLRTAFYGVPEFNKWNSDSQQIFRNILEWSYESTPEPSTLAFLGLGVIGLASARRRRQNGE